MFRREATPALPRSFWIRSFTTAFLHEWGGFGYDVSSWSSSMTMLLRELNDPRTELYPIKVSQYHRMIKQGIIEEGAPFELLNGAIVRKDRSAQGENPMTVGNEHIYTLMMMQDLAP